MKITINKTLLTLGLTIISLAVFVLPVNAQCMDGWIPSILQTYICNSSPEQFVQSRIRALFSIAVGILILLAIAMGLRMALKLITSGGKDSKKQEAFDGIKAILLGIASIFLIMLAIPLVLGYFGFSFKDMSSGILICTAAPDGAGCYACMNKGIGNNAQICSTCDSNTDSVIPYPATDNGTQSGNTTCKSNF